MLLIVITVIIIIATIIGPFFTKAVIFSLVVNILLSSAIVTLYFNLISLISPITPITVKQISIRRSARTDAFSPKLSLVAITTTD